MPLPGIVETAWSERKETMEKQFKRIGVLTSGGDAPGMNAAVRAVARTAIASGMECIGIRRGWQGLITSDFTMLDAASVGHILSRGGTILYTARSEEFMSEKGRKRAVSTCKMLGLDGVVAIGGVTQKGENKVKMTYEVPGLKAGGILTVVTFLAM